MYSPKIDEALIGPLYHLGKARKKPMTEVVNEILYEALVVRELPDEAAPYLDAARFKYQSTIQTRKEAA